MYPETVRLRLSIKSEPSLCLRRMPNIFCEYSRPARWICADLHNLSKQHLKVPSSSSNTLPPPPPFSSRAVAVHTHTYSKSA